MGKIFSSDLGGIRIMNSATTERNIATGQANIQDKEDTIFANKLKEVQDKANNVNLTPGQKDPEEDKKLREVCQEMEAVFLNMLLTKMRETVPERSLFKKSNGEKMMQSMMDIEMTRQMSQTGQFGLGDLLYKQVSNPGVVRPPIG